MTMGQLYIILEKSAGTLQELQLVNNRSPPLPTAHEDYYNDFG